MIMEKDLFWLTVLVVPLCRLLALLLEPVVRQCFMMGVSQERALTSTPLGKPREKETNILLVTFPGPPD